MHRASEKARTGTGSVLSSPPFHWGVPFQPKCCDESHPHLPFQKIRELQLQGRRIFGIHIEVFSAYRTNDADSPEYTCQAALVNALAQSIIKSFKLKQSY
ncbi:MAG: hypothetical protein RQM95_01805 [Syntrophaceticus schinkii]